MLIIKPDKDGFYLFFKKRKAKKTRKKAIDKYLMNLHAKFKN